MGADDRKHPRDDSGKHRHVGRRWVQEVLPVNNPETHAGLAGTSVLTSKLPALTHAL